MAAPQGMVEVTDKHQESTMIRAIHDDAVAQHSKRRSTLEITPAMQFSIAGGILGLFIGGAGGALLGMVIGPFIVYIGSVIIRNQFSNK